MGWRLPLPPSRQWDTEMSNRRSFSVGILLGLMAVCCFGLLAATAGTIFRHVPAGPRPRSCVIAFPNGDLLNVEVSATRDERGFGLMDRAVPGRGMLFIYPDAGQHRISMYRTHFQLDLVWLNHRQQIIDIAQGVPPCVVPPLLSLSTVFMPAVRTSKNSQLCVGTSARFCRSKRSPHGNVRQRPLLVTRRVAERVPLLRNPHR